MKRRHFMVAGGAGAALALVGGGGALALSNEESAIRRFLHRMFPDGRMSAKDEEEFVRQTAAALNFGRLKAPLAGAAMSSQTASDWLEDWGRVDLTFEGRLVNQYFRSTNYADPARGSRPVVLIGFADPYGMVCSNPLASWAESEGGLEWA